MGIPRVNTRGSWNQTAWSLQWAIYYMVKQHLETVLCKPLCHCGFKVSCAVHRVSGGAWLLTLSLPLQSPLTPSLDQVCSTLCSNCCNCLLARHVILMIFYDTCNAWYMVLWPWVDLIRSSFNQSERLPTPPFDWGKLVYSVANQNPRLMRRALSK